MCIYIYICMYLCIPRLFMMYIYNCCLAQLSVACDIIVACTYILSMRCVVVPVWGHDCEVALSGHMSCFNIFDSCAARQTSIYR